MCSRFAQTAKWATYLPLRNINIWRISTELVQTIVWQTDCEAADLTICSLRRHSIVNVQLVLTASSPLFYPSMTNTKRHTRPFSELATSGVVNRTARAIH